MAFNSSLISREKMNSEILVGLSGFGHMKDMVLDSMWPGLMGKKKIFTFCEKINQKGMGHSFSSVVWIEAL